MLFQGGALFDSLTLRQRLRFRYRKNRMSRANYPTRQRNFDTGGPEWMENNIPAIEWRQGKAAPLARRDYPEPKIRCSTSPTTGSTRPVARSIHEPTSAAHSGNFGLTPLGGVVM